MMHTTIWTAPVFGLRREIDRLFENTFGRNQVGRNEWTPAVDIHETNEELTFAVELPGIKMEDIEVTAVDGVLTIQGERSDERNGGEEGRFHLVERTYGSFMRRFQLPPGVDIEKIEADVEDGMLKVRIPKAALPQPRKIQINSTTSAGGRAQHAVGRGQSRPELAEVS